jgi:hypothetical protein
MEQNWSKIYGSNKTYEVEIMKKILADNNIKSVIINKQDSSFIIGSIELYVNDKDVSKAKQIIDETNIK